VLSASTPPGSALLVSMLPVPALPILCHLRAIHRPRRTPTTPNTHHAEHPPSIGALQQTHGDSSDRCCQDARLLVWAWLPHPCCQDSRAGNSHRSVERARILGAQSGGVIVRDPGRCPAGPHQQPRGSGRDGRVESLGAEIPLIRGISTHDDATRPQIKPRVNDRRVIARRMRQPRRMSRVAHGARPSVRAEDDA
jgi:hypothetical protein